MQAREPGGRGRRGLILGICCTSLFLTGLDTTIVNVALPSIDRDLGAPVSGLQWTVAAYTVALTACLLSSGMLADRVGRRRVFRAGLLAFAVASGLCSLAPSLGWLIAFRVLQGVAAAMLNPAALGIISATFTTRAGRARAIGVWDGVFGLSLALGPVVGGALTGLAGWRAVFLPSIPIALGANLLAALFVPDSRSPRPRRPDPAGQLLVIVALGSLAYAIIEGPQDGWASPATVCLLAVAVAAAAVLACYEYRHAEPVIDPRDFRQVPFSAAVVTAVCFTACLAGFLFLTTLYLQDARGYSPLRAGLAMLPMPAVMTACAPLAGRYVARHGPRLPLLAGGGALALSGSAIAWYLGRASAGSFTLPYALLGAGAGLCSPGITNTIMSGLPQARAAVASSMSSASRQLGQTLGTAITGTVLIVGLRGSLHAGYAHAGHAAWWVTAGFGAAIIPLTITAARPATPASQRRRAVPAPAAASVPAPAPDAGGASRARRYIASMPNSRRGPGLREPDILLRSVSPYGSRAVTVEYDGLVTAAYLSDGTSAVSVVWMANHRPAPQAPDRERLDAGRPPLMPASCTRHPGGRPPLEAAALEALWFEEGDGVAILESGHPAAVIAGWADADGGMPGYSADVIGQTPYGWSLGDAMEGLGPRLERARAFWPWRGSADGWSFFQGALFEHLSPRLGPGGYYWRGLPGGPAPLVGVTERPAGARPYTVLSTVGMSCQRMPAVEQVPGDPRGRARIELAVATTLPSKQAVRVFRWLAPYPWHDVTWFGPGHSVRWDDGPSAFPLGTGEAVLLLDAPGVLAGPEPPDLSGFTVAGEPVRWLWVVPITEQDRQMAMEQGSDSLVSQLAGERRSWITGPCPARR